MESESTPVEAAASSAPNPEKVRAAKELVAGILEHMGVAAELADDDRADGIHLSIKPGAGGEALRSGPRGGVVESIAYLVNKALNREEEGRKWIFVEVAGAPQAESPAANPAEIDEASKAAAAELVEKAKRLGGTLWMGPVPRRLRALGPALSAAGAKVRAEGEGIHRRLVVEVG